MDRVTKFAKANLKNKKDFGEDARLAFKRHINDLARSEKNDPNFPYRFDEEKAEDIIELANKLTIAEGEGNEQFTCAGFQEFIPWAARWFTRWYICWTGITEPIRRTYYG